MDAITGRRVIRGITLDLTCFGRYPAMKATMLALVLTLLAGCAIVPIAPYDPYYSSPSYSPPEYGYYGSYGGGYHGPQYHGHDRYGYRGSRYNRYPGERHTYPGGPGPGRPGR